MTQVSNSHLITEVFEEKINAIIHLIFFLLLCALGFDTLTQKIITGSFSGHIFLIYLFFTLSTFIISGAYHLCKLENNRKKLRLLDHISIFTMIAANYMPVFIVGVGGKLGNTAAVIIWTLAILGIFYKITSLGKWPRFSTLLYCVMGWSFLIFTNELLINIDQASIEFLLLGGLTYMVGVYFYSYDEKPYYHALWHIFSGFGALFHFFAIVRILS